MQNMSHLLSSFSGPCSSPDSHRSVFFSYHFECSVNGIIQFVAFRACHLLIRIMHLRFVHVFACVSSLFLYIAEQCSVVGIQCNLFIRSLVDRYMVCFQFGMIINKTTVHMQSYVLCEHVFISLECYILIYLNLGQREHLEIIRTRNKTSALL